MASVNAEQAVSILCVQQLINGWAHDLDINDGLSVSNLVTQDCKYAFGGALREGRSAVEKFYRERVERLSAQPDGIPTHRHILSNLRVSFRDPLHVSITFGLLYFTSAGTKAGVNHADPAAVADVRMDCRRDADGQWRIVTFDSTQTFRRTAN